jgi:hypothetical protein
MNIADFLGLLQKVKHNGDGFVADCPACNDTKQHLSVAEGNDGKILIKCFKGCETSAILQAMGLGLKDLFPPKEKPTGPWRDMTCYDYLDAEGKLVYQVVRLVPKDFRQRQPDPINEGKWIWNLKGVKPIPYRLPSVLKAKAEETIFVCEGEKDCDAVVRIGLTATCNSGGAGKWADCHSQHLVGATSVVIIADKDDAGRHHALLVAQSLQQHGVSNVRSIELPDRNNRKVKDAHDWISAGGTAEELKAIAATAPCDLPKPTNTPSPSGVMTNENAANAGKIADGSGDASIDGKPDKLDEDAIALRASFFEILHDKMRSVDERYKAMASETVEALNKRGRFYFHADLRDFSSGMYFDRNRRLLSLVSSDEFKAWLAGYTGLNISERAFDFVSSACKTETLAGKTTGIIPSSYWYATPTAIYLSNGDGQVVRIMAGKVEMVDNGTDDVLFAAGQTLRPWKLVEPSDPFLNCSLFANMAATPNGMELQRLWMLSLPTSQRCKPPIVFTGPIGGGKTRIAAGFFELFGMPPRIIILDANGEADFWTKLDAGGLVCFDNADTRIKWLPDALAAAATDGSHEKRQLYTDSKIIRHHSRSWVVVTSANPTFASDAGLADRLLVTRMERRTTETAESALSREIAKNRNSALSWVASILSKALADDKPVAGGNLNRRHPDFAQFAVKLGRAMGREAQAIAALQTAEADKGRFNLENDEIGAAVLELGEWRGTTAELLEALVANDASLDGKWSSKRLGKRISRLWPHLESVLHATKETEGHSKQTKYYFSNPAGYAGFQSTIQGKSIEVSSVEGFTESTSPNPANPAMNSLLPATTPTSVRSFYATNWPPDPDAVAASYGMNFDQLKAAVAAGSLPRPINGPFIVDGSIAFLFPDPEFEAQLGASEGDTTDNTASDGQVVPVSLFGRTAEVNHAN